MWVFWAGAEPAAEGSPFAIDGCHVWTWLGGKGGFGEAKSEFGFECCAENSTLSAEDSGVAATAVKAEDSGKVERSRVF